MHGSWTSSVHSPKAAWWSQLTLDLALEVHSSSPGAATETCTFSTLHLASLTCPRTQEGCQSKEDDG